MSRLGNPLRAIALAASFVFDPQLVDISGLRDAVLSWHIPAPAVLIRGARLFMDSPRRSGLAAAIARQILRTNPRLSPIDAVVLANLTIAAARYEAIDPAFLAAVLLQESAYNPTAISPAGALGIAQFTLETAAAYDIDDPFEPDAAIRGSAHLFARYLQRYAAARGGAYALAMAAYNAGPAAVEKYGGVPPYAETREYITDITERWSRIERDR